MPTADGYRSVEVHIMNNTGRDLVIQAASADQGSSWIAGEEATNGFVIKPYDDKVIGVLASETDAAGSFQLAGPGSHPLSVILWNKADGTSDVDVTPNEAVRGSKQILDNDEQNHTVFQLQLMPAAPGGSGA